MTALHREALTLGRAWRACGAAGHRRAPPGVVSAAGLDGRIEAALASPVASFAKGVVADRAAIAAPRSHAQTAGSICKLKTLKRQTDGRAKIGLSKARLMTVA